MKLGISVTDLDPEHLDELAALCLTARDEAALGAHICVADQAGLRQQLCTYAELPGTRIFVAYLDGSIVGFSLTRDIMPGQFLTNSMLYVELIYVDEGARRRGVGHQLMSKIAQTAHDNGAHDIYALPLPGSRGMQRFYARLGFAPAAAHRVVTTQALLRHLATETKRPRRGLPPLKTSLRGAVEPEAKPTQVHWTYVHSRPPTHHHNLSLWYLLNDTPATSTNLLTIHCREPVAGQ